MGDCTSISYGNPNLNNNFPQLKYGFLWITHYDRKFISNDFISSIMESVSIDREKYS